ncbi:hypothetical protein G647_02617 [Cladophialophora carrionii CBS 160.54]|uniref:U6 snRNA phosphodiesterase n=1 Tax=Cladophialophora carrionii CBS 160.54 TaxID=1279043 RepID=V9DG43_9EURO|nr:uncharacterized protein G647_02617 [Cladophialophora carrionii CBS 160.54]ETI25840.1 hypothetical protein G647_02617 [Cladophialophora carrionii CBS 160.54]
MALVDYSDSSSESEGQELADQENHQQGRRKRKADHIDDETVHSIRSPPPLPASFHSLYATNVRTSTTDDPSLHAGRTRQVPHVVGNWPTHIYLEWYPPQAALARLDTLIQTSSLPTTKTEQTSKAHVHGFLRSDLGAQLPLHISLSAPLVLKTEQKESFQGSINAALDSSHIKPFTVTATRLDWVANHDRSRFFLVLRLSKPEDDELNKLLSICNATAVRFGLSQLYNDIAETDQGGAVQPRSRTPVSTTDKSDAFHISIAWTLQDPKDRARKLVGLGVDQLHGLKVSFSLLKIKMGNTVIDLPLGENREAGR